ncbi:hypothetical protein DPMN_159488 [Dreissena polymorpha]|uniref:Uncharacterized protein n=1 Tax=Dreissena polymorpha TaxID=45954 RepID=A0A9D4ELI2_DREPO|nr:hypothetical protein DPMN_159488 [Dreissena polymorpha]
MLMTSSSLFFYNVLNLIDLDVVNSDFVTNVGQSTDETTKVQYTAENGHRDATVNALSPTDLDVADIANRDAATNVGHNTEKHSVHRTNPHYN